MRAMQHLVEAHVETSPLLEPFLIRLGHQPSYCRAACAPMISNDALEAGFKSLTTMDISPCKAPNSTNACTHSVKNVRTDVFDTHLLGIFILGNMVSILNSRSRWISIYNCSFFCFFIF